ncbi:general transcription factor 3C polypeptide 1 [Hippocampus comes]|uniref:general transcription factor 3C polypeptide 1 n=1 Tax=Hippocampus comes TaxID=109280 RepID=UPI00094E1427|nr:PREDICTED: general transcription factor 3C polypeptide 1 [Hippocampus comes]
MDPLSIVEDEVALEGLDGITIPALWIRLGDRKPRFPLKLDDSTKEFIWRSLVANSDLTFYLLPAERDDVVLYDRFQSNEENDVEDKDVYPVHIIRDNKDGLQGSCATFCQRRDVTARLRSPSPIALDESLKRYGRKLVAVASQGRRFLALIGSESDPDAKLTDDSYCMLERVGRARWQGEMQSELHKSSFKVDSRKLHYIRKPLIRHRLVCAQACSRQLKSGQAQSSILLLLKRFHVIRRSKYDLLMEGVSNILQKIPRQLAAMVTIREHLNLPEGLCKRVFRHMREANLVEYCSVPLEDLDEEKKPVRTRKGNKVHVRCLKLIKPYRGKFTTAADEWKDDEDNEEDDDDDDEDSDRRRALPPVGRIMEQDVLSQAYKLVASYGTKGIPQSGIASRMNVGKLEARMLWRKLERDGVIKGFMVDEGRQRVTYFLSHRSVGGSDDLQLLSKEKQRKKLFHSSASPVSTSTPKASCPTPAAGKQRQKTPTKSRGASEEVEEEGEDASLDSPDKVGKESTGKAVKKPKAAIADVAPIPAVPDAEPVSTSERASVEEKEEEEGSLPLCQEEEGTAVDLVKDIVVVNEVDNQPDTSNRRHRETYRVLRRKNLIIEAVHKLKVIDGLYHLQKLINDEEKLQGLTIKCCKKTTARLVQTLSREGLLKIFTTNVIQDGITRKMELFVHPSVQPSDELVRASIDQVRFKITSSCATSCQQAASKDSPLKVEKQETSKSFKSFAEIKEEYAVEAAKFKPTVVRGLGKTLGFQPKMHRLRVLHTFLWYVIYDHPMGPRPPWLATPQDAPEVVQEPPERIDDDNLTLKDLDAALSGEEDEAVMEISSHSNCEIKVYCEEDSWKRFVPPVRRHCDRGIGWAIVGDLLLCLPLSLFVQLVQINYQVDGLEEYLNDPVKQHHLIRQLPLAIRKQLFFRRKYVYLFFENLQRLVCMGLLQLGPVEKLKEKDMLFCYLKRHATIVDTVYAEPHYWLVEEPPDKPFDRRRYTFSSTDDVDTYWFDLMCVCLNTPLGVIRSKRGASENEVTPSFVNDRSLFMAMASLLKGSNIVCDDGTTPGDGKGAGGLSSEFFAHMKRNWLWTNHLLACKRRPTGPNDTKVRLKSLLSKEALRAALKAAASSPRFLTAKKSVVTKETVEVAVEPSSRNQEVVGGKQRKRKRPKKEVVVKVPRKKKKEPKKRTPAHDEADHEALKKMTRRRVIWTVQEDSLLMLCGVASHLLNSKLRRTFVAYCVVRDLLQAEFQISEDKTSLAVGRRTRYILKNPQTFLNYRICLAEIYQDKDLLKQLQDNKPADPNNADECARAFSEYVKLLRQKFSSALNADDVKLPENKHQVFSELKVFTIHTDRQIPCRDTLTRTADVHALVLFNLIQSTLAMTNNQMKESRSFQTFQIYSQYSQELLCRVFIECRKRHLVNQRRVCRTAGRKKNRALPILPMSFQLSQSYFRLFSWRFPHTLCTDSFRFLKTLLNNGRGDNRSFVSYHLETENRTESGEEAEDSRTTDLEHSGMMRFHLDSVGGACLVALTLMSLGLLSVHMSIPKKMVVVDSNLVDSDVRSMVSLEEEDDEDDVASDECLSKKKLRVNAHQASHTKYLLMKGYCIPGIVKRRNMNTSDNIVVESCVLRMQMRQTPACALLSDDGVSLDFSKSGPSLLPSVLTRSIQKVGRTPALCSSYSPEDVQVSAQLRKHLDTAGEKGVDQVDLFRELAHLCRPQSGCSRSLEQYLEDLQKDGQVLKVGGYGVRWVLIQHADPWILTVNPRNGSQLQAATGEDPSQHNIPFLYKRRRVEGRRDDKNKEEPPAKKMASEERLKEEEDKEAVWTIPPKAEDPAVKVSMGRECAEMQDECHPAEDKMEDEEEDGGASLAQEADIHEDSVSFVVRPWRLVDGTLNRQVCKGMLEAVLHHIMSRPGIPHQKLLSYYEGVLQPVVLLELLESLVELGCVVKKTLFKRPKPTLFGPPMPTTEEQQESVFYEPTVSCCLRLARVLPNERHWNYCGK